MGRKHQASSKQCCLLHCGSHWCHSNFPHLLCLLLSTCVVANIATFKNFVCEERSFLNASFLVNMQNNGSHHAIVMRICSYLPHCGSHSSSSYFFSSNTPVPIARSDAHTHTAIYITKSRFYMRQNMLSFLHTIFLSCSLHFISLQS